MHDKARRPGRESPRPAGRDRSAWRSGRLRRSAGTQSYHGRSAVGHDFLAGDVPCLGDRAGKAQVLQQIAAAARLEIVRSEEHTSELQSQSNLVCRLLLETKNSKTKNNRIHKRRIA